VRLSDGQRRLLHLLAFVAAIPLALVMLVFAYAKYVDWRYITPWQKVARGDTEDHVIALLGQPHRIVFEHSDKAGWVSEHKIEWYDAESVKSFRYVPFSITGEEYEVSFDSSGRAVSEYHITSP
jgi:hypothetical protein